MKELPYIFPLLKAQGYSNMYIYSTNKNYMRINAPIFSPFTGIYFASIITQGRIYRLQFLHYMRP